MSGNQLPVKAVSDEQGQVADFGRYTDLWPTSFQEVIPIIRKLEKQLSFVIGQSSSDKTTQIVLHIRSLIKFIMLCIPHLRNAFDAYSTAHALVQVSSELIANVHAPGISQKVGAELVQAVSSVFPSDIVLRGESLLSILKQVIDILSYNELSSALLLHAHKRLCYAQQILASLRLESLNFTPQNLASLSRDQLTNKRSTLRPHGNYASHPLSMSATSEKTQRLPISLTKTPVSATATNSITVPQDASYNRSISVIQKNATQGVHTFAMNLGEVSHPLSRSATSVNTQRLPISLMKTPVSAAATNIFAVAQGASHNGSISVIPQNATQGVNTFAMTHGDVTHPFSMNATSENTHRLPISCTKTPVSVTATNSIAVPQNSSHKGSILMMPQNVAQGVNTFAMTYGDVSHPLSMSATSENTQRLLISSMETPISATATNSIAVPQDALHNGSILMMPQNVAQGVNTFTMDHGDVSHPLITSATSENTHQLPINSMETPISATATNSFAVPQDALHNGSILMMPQNVAQGVNTFTMDHDDVSHPLITSATSENTHQLPINSMETPISATASNSFAVPQDALHNGSILMMPQNVAQGVNTFAMTHGDVSYPLSMSTTNENTQQLPISPMEIPSATATNSIAVPQDALHNGSILMMPQNVAEGVNTFVMTHDDVSHPFIMSSTNENTQQLPFSLMKTPVSATATKSIIVPQDVSHNGSIFVIPQNLPQGVNTFAVTQGDVQGGSSSGFLQSVAPAGSNKNSSDQVSSERERPCAKSIQSENGCKRTWNHVSSAKDMGMELTVMSYNILSQKLLTEHSYLYTRSNRQDLEWDARCAALCQEIISHDSDIICLQEVEEMEWMMDIFPFFNLHGYVGIYKKKTGNRSDGCAILFKRSKFSLIKSVPVEYCKGGVLDRDNIGLIVVLQPNRPFYQGNVQKICVATTHLLFNPKRGDVKLAQLMLLLAELDKHATVDCFPSQQSAFSSGYTCSYKPDFPHADTQETLRDSHPYCPTILCGDFNMEPMTELYRFVTEGYIHYTKCIARAIAGQREGQDSSSYMTYIPRSLLPKHLRITEKCQYAEINHKRRVQAQRFLGGDLLVNGIMNPSVSGIAQYFNRFPALLQNPTQSMNIASLSAETSCMPLNITGQSSISREQFSGLIEKPSIVTECSSGNSGQNNPKDQPADSGAPLVYGQMMPIGGSNWETNAFNTGQASHSFNFKSGYRHCTVNKGDVSEEVSSWHMKACCTLDYIFYSSGMVLVETAEPPAAKHTADSPNKKGHIRGSSRKKVKGDCDSDESPKQKRKGKSTGKHKSKRSKLDSPNSGTKETDNDSVIVIDLLSEDQRGHDSDSLSDSLKSPNQNNGSVIISEPSKSTEYRERLQLLSNFSLFTYPDILLSKPIPNAENASDHFCLIAKFLLR